MTNTIARSVKTAAEVATDLLHGHNDEWDEPYIERIKTLVLNIQNNEASEAVDLDDLLMATWLHPVLRIPDRFGTRVTWDSLVSAGYPVAVADAVTALTRLDGEGWSDYTERAAANPIGRIILFAIMRYELIKIRTYRPHNKSALLARWTATERYLDELGSPDEAFSPASKLVMDIMSRNAEQAAKTHNMLYDSMKRERDDLEATVEAIRGEVAKLFAGPYLPHPNHVIDALYPPDHIVSRYRDK